MQTVQFYNPTDVIGIGTPWVIQTANPVAQSSRANGLGADGDEVAWKEYDKKTALSLTYKSYDLTGSLVLPVIGAVMEGYHVDSFNVGYDPNGSPSLNVSCHKHTGTTGSHVDGDPRKYTTALSLPAQFGIPFVLANVFNLTNAGIGIRSMTIGVSCTHSDELNGKGEWLAGNNNDGAETVDVEFTGVPADGEISVDAAWHDNSDATPKGNTVAESRKLNLVRHFATD